MTYIITGIRTGKSISVTYNGKYFNTRPPHVETTDNVLSGISYLLGKRHTKKIKDNIAVMYDVQGLKNGNFSAHITTYFGPLKNSTEY